MDAKKGSIYANFVKPEALGSVATTAITYAVSQGMTFDELAQTIDMSALDYANQDARFPDAFVGELMSALASRFPGRAISMEIAQSAPFSMLGSLVQGIFFAADLETALTWLVENQSVIADQSVVHFEKTPSDAAIVVSHPCEVIGRGIAIEAAMGLIWRLLKEICSTEISLKRVELANEKVALLPAYETFFQSPVLFETGRNALVFSLENLRSPIRHADAEMFDFIRRQFENLRRKLELDPCPAALVPLKRSIMENAVHGEYGAVAAAAAANLSLRTAQRIATQHSTSLQKLIDEIRLANAKNFLSNPQFSVETVAQLLGYSDVRAFRRAFKRWTGLSPKAYCNEIFKA